MLICTENARGKRLRNYLIEVPFLALSTLLLFLVLEISLERRHFSRGGVENPGKFVKIPLPAN